MSSNQQKNSRLSARDRFSFLMILPILIGALFLPLLAMARLEYDSNFDAKGLSYDALSNTEKERIGILLPFAASDGRPVEAIQLPNFCDPFERVGTAVDKLYGTKVSAYRDGRWNVVLSFRGTRLTNRGNWLANLNFLPQRCVLEGARNRPRCGKVHRGFQKAYLRLRTRLTETVKDARRIYLTGHSLGGALAILAAYDLKVHGNNVTDLVVFGTPHVGNWRFEAAFSHLGINEVRLVQVKGWHRDPVTMMPPKIFGFVDPFNSVIRVDCYQKQCIAPFMHLMGGYVSSVHRDSEPQYCIHFGR